MTLGCGTARKDCFGKVAEMRGHLWGVSLSLIIQSFTTQILGGGNLEMATVTNLSRNRGSRIMGKFFTPKVKTA